MPLPSKAMDPQRNFPGETGSNKLLWAGVAIAVIMALVMGATVIRIQAQPDEPRLVVLPTMEAPPANAASAVTGASTDTASPAAPLPSPSTATEPRVDTPKPRIVQPHTPEPAVARAPQRLASKPGAVESDTLPGFKP